MNAASQLRMPSVQLKNVLFAADFSPGSLQAFPFAASIARHYDGRLLLEHVASAEQEGNPPAATRAGLDRIQSAIEAALNRSGDRLDDIPHEMLFDRGNICSRLLATAKERSMDLIVVGTYGKRGMKKFVKGSTAEEIVFLAACPVLTAGPKVDRRADFRRILCAIDFSPAAMNAIPYALSLAEIYDASLVFLHVNDWSSSETPVDARPKTFDFVHEQLCKTSYGAAIEPHCKVIVDFGPRSDLTVEAATNHEVDLIVMGLRAGKGIKVRIAAHLPGSMAYDVIAQAPCPVLTVPLPRAA
jgi:nucleotide-binding universal stress UspA family protein